MAVPGASIGKSNWQFETRSTRFPAATSSVSAEAPIVQRSHSSSSSFPREQISSEIPDTQLNDELLPRSCVAPAMRELFAFEYFNRMQSRCFPVLYDGTENCVIGAPTAAGKTVCFELAMAAHFGTKSAPHNPPVTRRALYLAPLKSLIQERLKEWRHKLSPLGLRCQEVSGDLEDSELHSNANLYLATPEKWDAITRKWKEQSSMLGQIGLIMVDEVHLLGDGRGYVLESVLARTLVMTRNDRPPRIIALSASSPNVHDIGKWIGAPQNCIFTFGESHRPIRPKLHVLGYPPSKNDYFFDKVLESKLWSVIARYGENKPTLVFCSSRKSAISSASKLLELCSQNGSSYVTSTSQKERLFDAAKLVQNDPQLAACILSGIAFHHAGMPPENRTLVERLFCTGKDVMVVAATSTLAVGVNLPAYLVIIKSTNFWSQANGVEELSPLAIRQMIGRAGRPQFGDTEAAAVIMTQEHKVSTYESILDCESAVTESVLHHRLADVLLSEIALGSVDSFKSALLYLQRTFLAVRIQTNPMHYLNQSAPNSSASRQTSAYSSGGDTANSTHTHPLLRSICMASLASLTKFECVHVDGLSLTATELGKIVNRYFVSFESVQAIIRFFTPSMENTPNSNSDEGSRAVDTGTRRILECIASSPQFSDVLVRRAEKKELKEFSSQSRFPVPKGIQQNEKVMILIQSVFIKKFSDVSLHTEAESAISTAISLCHCLVQFFLDRKWFEAMHRALILVKCLRRRVWTQSPTQTTQIPIITKDMALTLSNRGFHTLLDLSRASFDDLSAALPHQPPAFLQNVLTRLNQIPSYSMSILSVQSANAVQLKIQFCALHAERSISDKRGFRWLVLSQRGIIIAHRLVPLPTVQNTADFSMTINLDADIHGEVELIFVSDEWIGFDIAGTICIENRGYQHLAPSNEVQDPYNDTSISKQSKKRKRSTASEEASTVVSCTHKCKNKFLCRHECCKMHPEVKSTGSIHIELPAKSTQPLALARTASIHFGEDTETDEIMISRTASPPHKRPLIPISIPPPPQPTRPMTYVSSHLPNHLLKEKRAELPSSNPQVVTTRPPNMGGSILPISSVTSPDTSSQKPATANAHTPKKPQLSLDTYKLQPGAISASEVFKRRLIAPTSTLTTGLKPIPTNTPVTTISSSAKSSSTATTLSTIPNSTTLAQPTPVRAGPRRGPQASPTPTSLHTLLSDSRTTSHFGPISSPSTMHRSFGAMNAEKSNSNWSHLLNWSLDPQFTREEP